MTMLPRLEAQRQIDGINAMSAAFGGMRPFDRSRFLGRLEQQASGAERSVKMATPQSLAAMGVSVVVLAPDGSVIDG